MSQVSCFAGWSLLLAPPGKPILTTIKAFEKIISEMPGQFKEYSQYKLLIGEI